MAQSSLFNSAGIFIDSGLTEARLSALDVPNFFSEIDPPEMSKTPDKKQTTPGLTKTKSQVAIKRDKDKKDKKDPPFVGGGVKASESYNQAAKPVSPVPDVKPQTKDPVLPPAIPSKLQATLSKLNLKEDEVCQFLEWVNTNKLPGVSASSFLANLKENTRPTDPLSALIHDNPCTETVKLMKELRDSMNINILADSILNLAPAGVISPEADIVLSSMLKGMKTAIGWCRSTTYKQELDGFKGDLQSVREAIKSTTSTVETFISNSTAMQRITSAAGTKLSNQQFVSREEEIDKLLPKPPSHQIPQCSKQTLFSEFSLESVNVRILKSPTQEFKAQCKVPPTCDLPFSAQEWERSISILCHDDTIRKVFCEWNQKTSLKLGKDEIKILRRTTKGDLTTGLSKALLDYSVRKGYSKAR